MDFIRHLPEATFSQEKAAAPYVPVWQNSDWQTAFSSRDRDCVCDCPFASCPASTATPAETVLVSALQAETKRLGETVQKADSVPELLAVSRSLQETLTQLLVLDQTLYRKLQKALGSC